MTTNPAPAAGDWPEDSAEENGNYNCRCFVCSHMFTGHKRRIVCRVCATPPSIKSELAMLRAEVLRLEQELARATAWKESQLTVEAEWDAQEVGRLLEMPLGCSIRANIAPRIRDLHQLLAVEKARAEKAESERDKLREEVEVLRSWGNKDCTAMADAELERRRSATTPKAPTPPVPPTPH